MYNETSCVVRSKNKVARYVLMGLIGSSAIFIAAANLTPKFSGLVWLVAFSFAVAAIYVFNRYVGTEFCYSILDTGTPSLVITQKVGKTVRTMARLDVSYIIEVRPLSGKEYRAHKRDKGVLKYSYFPTMCPASLYLVSVRSNYENADVFIEADESFVKAINEVKSSLTEGYDPY